MVNEYRKMLIERNIKLNRSYTMTEEIDKKLKTIPDVVEVFNKTIHENIKLLKNIHATDTEIKKSIKQAFSDMGLSESISKTISEKLIK